MNTKIKSVYGRANIDCKGKPVLEVDVITEDGVLGRASSPSGISAGMHEAFVLRDGDPNWYNGAGVFKAVEMVEKVIGPAVIGMDVTEQTALDRKLIELDGTPNKSKLGGNCTYSVSLAVLRAAAAIKGLPLYKYLAKGPIKTLPLPTSNCFSGGSYQKNSMPFQEVTVVPYKAKTMQECVHTLAQVYGKMPAAIMEFSGQPAIPGSHSSYRCPSSSPDDAFAMVTLAVEMAGLTGKVAFAADCAFSEIYNADRKTYDLIGKEVDLDELLGFLGGLTEKYNFIYMEDVVDENDWEGWSKAAKVLNRTILVGDDLTVTNIEKLKLAVKYSACGAYILKPNQVGTVTETLEAEAYAKEHGILSIPSIRAGGVVDDPVIEMAIAFGSAAVKQGPPRNGHCIEPLNTLLRAENQNPGVVPFDFTPYIRF
ncbi:MAG TPA: hypothetical protein VN446_00230 [Candidatus Acidoferrum sp.]|nr:hypothetical protein [Candidatus Acidoferrum sp.]